MHSQPKEGEKRQRFGGRAKGTPNKTTASVREAIARMAETNAPKLGRWLNEVYEQDGPAKAIECYAKLVEYHIPKQRQVDLVTTHIDLAAILDRARSRLIDVTPSPAIAAPVVDDAMYMQQVTERLTSELAAPYDPTELDGASEDDTAP